MGGCHFEISKPSSEPRQSLLGWMARESLPRIVVVVASCDETNCKRNRTNTYSSFPILMLTNNLNPRVGLQGLRFGETM